MHTFNNFPIIFLTCTRLILANSIDDWCNVKCWTGSYNILNTVCRRKPCKKSTHHCPDNAKDVSIRSSHGEGIHKLINDFRDTLAYNFKSKFKLKTTIANLNKFVWSKELAFSARCWARYCPTHKDTCTISPSFETVSQSIFIQNSHMSIEDFLEEAVSQWTTEILPNLKQNQTIPDVYLEEFGYYPDFFQVVWADTKYLGCAATSFDEKMVLVCNFSPAGNIPGKQIFRHGPAGSECKKTDEEFKGLCQVEELDDFEPPFKMGSKSGSRKLEIVYFIYVLLTSFLLVFTYLINLL